MLYAILDPDVAKGRDLLDLARRVVDGGATWVQLRAKHLPDGELLRLAQSLVTACGDRAGVWVNDRADIAALSGAYGVHVGQDDLNVAQARRVLRPGQKVGLSTHDLAQVEDAVRQGADIIAFGPIFQTATKQGHAPVTGAAALSAVAARVGGRPLVAIGGINAGNAGACISHGATHVAVIGALAHAADATVAARELVAACAAGRAG